MNRNFKIIIIIVGLIILVFGVNNLYHKIQAQSLLKQIEYAEIYVDETIKLDKNTCTKLFPHAVYRKKEYLRKGSLDGKIKLKSNKIKKIRISYYGGIFEIKGIKGHFVFEENYRKLWENIIFGK